MSPEQIQEIIKREQADCDTVCAATARFKKALPSLVPILSSLPSLRFCYYYPHNSSVILAIKTREDLAVVRSLYSGKWDKYKGDLDDGESLRYQATTLNGVHIDCRVTELPPSCQIVEETVLVPETLVPAHTRTTRKLVCNDPTKDKADQPDKVLSVEHAPISEAPEMEEAF